MLSQEIYKETKHVFLLTTQTAQEIKRQQNTYHYTISTTKTAENAEISSGTDKKRHAPSLPTEFHFS